MANKKEFELNEDSLENVSGGGVVKWLKTTNPNYDKGARFVARSTYNGKEVFGYFKHKDVAKAWIDAVENLGCEPLENGHHYY